jgi:integral membrane protein
LTVRPDAVRLVVRGYRIMAYITGTLLCILVFILVPLQIWGHNAKPANDVGVVHGILYIIYLGFAFMLTTRCLGMKLVSRNAILVLLAGTVPIMTFVVEAWVRRTYIRPVLAQADAGPSEQPVLR